MGFLTVRQLGKLCANGAIPRPVLNTLNLLAPAVTVGETEGAMDSTSVFFWPLLLPITL